MTKEKQLLKETINKMEQVANMKLFDEVTLAQGNDIIGFAYVDDPYVITLTDYYYLTTEKKQQSTIAHELVHILLYQIIEKYPQMVDKSWYSDYSPLHSLLCKWFSSHEVVTPQNYSISRKFKTNKDFIYIMADKPFKEVYNFIMNFFKYISDTGYITINNRIRKSKRDWFAKACINLSNTDFTLPNYKEFIENIA